MGTCCCGGESKGARSIVVIGTPGSGVTTITRRLRELCAHHRDDSTRGGVCDASSQDHLWQPTDGARRSPETWFPAPLPTLAMDSPAVPVQYRRAALRIIDAGPCTLRPPLQRPIVPDAGPATAGAQARTRLPDGNQTQDSPEHYAREALARCDGVILVIDASQPIAAQGAGAVAALIARTKAHGRPMAVLLTKYDTASRRSLPSFLSPRLVASALQLRERKGPWSCYPCVATHRCLSLDPVLGFLLAPDRVPPSKAAPQLGSAPPPMHEWQAQPQQPGGHHRRQSSGVASQPGLASAGSGDRRRSRAVGGDGYVAYSDGATHVPQPTSAATQPGSLAAAAGSAEEPPPCSSFPDEDGTPPPQHGSDPACMSELGGASAAGGSDDDDVELAVVGPSSAASPAPSPVAAPQTSRDAPSPAPPRLAAVQATPAKRKGYQPLARAAL